MITDNNKYLAALTTIPIKGIDDPTLDLTVIPPTAKNPNKTVSIRNIFLSNSWCIQVEPTQMPRQIMLVTTKGQLANAHQWLDKNLNPLFMVYLTCNTEYVPNKENPIPTRMDKVQQTSAMQTYVQSLIRKYHVSPYQPTQSTDKRFDKPPVLMKRFAKLTYNLQNFPPLPTNPLATPPPVPTTDNSSSPNLTTTGTSDPNLAAPTPKIDLAAIQKEIEHSLREDFQHLIHTEIGTLRQEFQSTTTEIRKQYDQMATMVDLLHQQNAKILASLNQIAQI